MYRNGGIFYLITAPHTTIARSQRWRIFTGGGQATHWLYRSQTCGRFTRLSHVSYCVSYTPCLVLLYISLHVCSDVPLGISLRVSLNVLLPISGKWQRQLSPRPQVFSVEHNIQFIEYRTPDGSKHTYMYAVKLDTRQN